MIILVYTIIIIIVIITFINFLFNKYLYIKYIQNTDYITMIDIDIRNACSVILPHENIVDENFPNITSKIMDNLPITKKQLWVLKMVLGKRDKISLYIYSRVIQIVNEEIKRYKNVKVGDE